MQTIKRDNLGPDMQREWDKVDRIIHEWNDKTDKSATLWAIEESEGTYRAMALDLFDTYEAGKLYSADGKTALEALYALAEQFKGS